MENAEFAPCECNADEEEWEIEEQSEKEGAIVVEYQCQTCGEYYVHSSSVRTV